jgi:hypothetical protein
MFMVLSMLLIISYYLLSKVNVLYVMHVTMSISIGLYPKLDLWTANHIQYITLHQPHETNDQQHQKPCW